MDVKEYRPVMKKKCEFDDLSKLMDQDCRKDLVFRGVSNSEYDSIPSAYRPKTKLVLKKEAECYLSKQNMFRIDENANFEMVFHEVAVLRWLYEEVNKKGLPVPDTPHSDSGNEFLDVQRLSFNLDGKRFIDEWSEIAALAQHYGIPTRMLDWTTDFDMAVNFAVKDLPEEGSDEDHAKMVGLWILDRSKVALLGSEIKFVTTKYYGNENITEQQGLFTVIAGSDPGENLEAIIERRYSEVTGGTRMGIEHDGLPILLKLCIPYKDALMIRKKLKDEGKDYDMPPSVWYDIVRSMEIQSGVRNA